MRKFIVCCIALLWTSLGQTHELANTMNAVLPSVVYIQVEQFVVRDRINEVTKEVTKIRLPVTPAVGTGFIIDDNIAVTNYHVVAFATANNTGVYVTFYESNQRHKARVIGYDKIADVALLKLEGTFPSVKISTCANLRMGDPVFSISHFYGIGWSGTQGTVSSVKRTDVRYPYINNLQLQLLQGSGSSGGAVFNGKGEVVALNRSIVAMFPRSILDVGRSSSMLSMVGYPVRGDTLVEAVAAIRKDIIVVRLDLGASITDFGPDSQFHINYASGDPYFPTGTMVLDIDADTISNLKPTDIIISIEGKNFSTAVELFSWLNSQTKFKAGDDINVQVYRDLKIINITVEIKLAGL